MWFKRRNLRTLDHETYFLISVGNDAQLGEQKEEPATGFKRYEGTPGTQGTRLQKVGFAMVTPPTPLNFSNVSKSYADFTLLF